MHFSKTLFTVATMVLAVAASPVDIAARTTPAQEAQQKCGNNLQASCCNSVTKAVGGLLGLNIGLGCTAIDGRFPDRERVGSTIRMLIAISIEHPPHQPDLQPASRMLPVWQPGKPRSPSKLQLPTNLHRRMVWSMLALSALSSSRRRLQFAVEARG